jgi:aryl-alcohol dehydrogenase-like predicted oxidoreductase/enamine deaminase RidA (YjgF/YER057c/UK114 family)
MSAIDHTPLSTFTLGGTKSLPRVLTGLWQIADLERDGATLDEPAALAAAAALVASELTAFDMADHYGSSELLLGKLRGRLPPAAAALLWCSTKWVPKPGAIAATDVARAVATSCARLRVEALDLLQFHCWDYSHPSYLDGLHFLAASSSIRMLGVTNFNTAHLRVCVADGAPIVSNQVCVSLLDRRAVGGYNTAEQQLILGDRQWCANGEMARFCEARGIKILAYGVLAGGFLSDRWLGKVEPAILGEVAAGVNDGKWTWSQLKYARFINEAGGWAALQRLLRALRRVADAETLPALRTIAAVAARWVLAQRAVGAVLIGARLGVSDHSAASRAIAAAGPLVDPRALAMIEEGLREMRPLTGDCGDEYRRAPFLTASGDLSHHLDNFPPPFTVHAEEEASSNGSSGRGGARVDSGTTWERIAAFSRARLDASGRISISGTTATHSGRCIGVGDVVAQTHFAIDKIDGALRSLQCGVDLRAVTRTRVYIRNEVDWEPVARALGERFAGIDPANTMVVAGLVGEEYLVEIEAEAFVDLKSERRRAKM